MLLRLVLGTRMGTDVYDIWRKMDILTSGVSESAVIA